MRLKHYYYLSALLIIIIIIYICIEYFVSINYYYYNSGRMNKIQKDLFENNKIEYNEKKWNIYIPNGYNFIDIELSKLKLNNNGKGKYIFTTGDVYEGIIYNIFIAVEQNCRCVVDRSVDSSKMRGSRTPGMGQKGRRFLFAFVFQFKILLKLL